MRPTTTLIQLYLLAPVVFSSPIPLVLVTDLEAVSGAAHPPAPVAAHRPAHALPEVIVFNAKEDNEMPIDNSDIAPSATEEPSVVLASPRPIPTEYLLSLTHHPWGRRKGGDARKYAKFPADVVAALESSSITQLEMGMGAEEEIATARMGMPCYHARMAQRHNDVLAIALIFLFVAVVAAVEMLDRVTGYFTNRGAIRLEAAPGTEQQKPLSVKSDPTEDFSEKQAI